MRQAHLIAWFLVTSVAFALLPAAHRSASSAEPLASALGQGMPHPVPPGSLEADPPTAEKTPKPSAREWKQATELTVPRRGARAADCTVWRLREWVRVSCPKLVTASISMLGGTAEGMAFWIDPPSTSESKLPSGGEVLFPLRRGDKRVVQFLTFGLGYEGPFTHLPALVVQEVWPPSATHPTIMMY